MESLWVKKVLINTSIDHIHPLETAGVHQPDTVLAADQIRTLDQLNAHQPCKMAVFEVGTVVHSWCQEDNIGVFTPGCQFLEGSKKLGWISVNRSYMLIFK